MFAQFPLSFEFYGDDIKNARTEDVPDLTQNVEQAILAEELKLSCTKCDAAVPGYREPLYFHSWNHVPCGQPHCRGYPGHHAGGLPPASVKGA